VYEPLACALSRLAGVGEADIVKMTTKTGAFHSGLGIVGRLTYYVSAGTSQSRTTSIESAVNESLPGPHQIRSRFPSLTFM
jgi:hypothetical protein